LKLLPTALLYDERYLLHQTGPDHPERPERIEAVWEYLQKRDFFPSLLLLKPADAPLEWIQEVHEPSYIERVKVACAKKEAFIDSLDTAVSPESYEIARLATGGVLRLIDAVFQGEARNGFALLRPPGHHAERDQALGFCLFNHVAIGARYAQKKYKIQKVLIVDWDVHHGNGTQHFFEEDPSVFYFSAHQFPFYPGTGYSWERGIRSGYGATLNIPLPAGTRDEDYLKAFDEQFLPRASEFRPEFILISAGFDAHREDPLAGLELTEGAYREMTQRLKEVAKGSAGERIVSVLEGGYNLEALARSVEEHLIAMREP
jgi:acetoin utilization deacetylase AcuC-like enzyme